MTDDVEFCSLLASTLDGLGRPGMAEELVLQKPPPFFAAEFDILSWYSIILWKLSQTCHFYLERQKQVQHSPTVCFNAFFYWPRSRKTSIFLTCYSWLTTDNNINNSTFVYIFLLLNFDSDGLTNKIFTTIHIFMTNLCTNINNFFENCVSLSFFAFWRPLFCWVSSFRERTTLPDQSFQTITKKSSKKP